MSFAMHWIQEAERLLREAKHDDRSGPLDESNLHSEKWHEDVNKLLKPKQPTP